jgi:hemolysin III
MVQHAATPRLTVKPRWRGLSHQWAFGVAVIAGALLVLGAPSSRAAAVAAIYGAALAGMFGASALYHRVNWRARLEPWMRRLDHAMIFVLIAGSYTPVALLLLHGALASVLLVVLWAGALGGIVLKLAWITAPSWLVAGIYVALGWAGAAAFPTIVSAAGLAPALMIVVGGVLYTMGAVVYARRRPDPRPAVFGFHEVFHLFVIAAAAVHFVAIAVYVIPRG